LVDRKIVKKIEKDGSNRLVNNSPRILLSCQNRDKEQLKQFLSDTNSNYLISEISIKGIKINGKFYDKEYHQCKLQFSMCDKWVKDLNDNWNIPTGNKTFKTCMPNIRKSNRNALLAYIKGITDGDGTIYLSKYRFKLKNGTEKIFRCIKIQFLGTLELLSWIKNFLESYLTFNERNTANITPERTGSKIYKYTISGKNAIYVFNLLRNITPRGIERKWQNPEILSFLQENNLPIQEVACNS
jgi:hypothetical protein